MTHLGSWSHLVGRFFDVMTARPLTGEERREIEKWLRGPAEAEMFWAQPATDQRHGLVTARLVANERPDRTDLVRAALLHDVGKRHAGLGLIGRSVASLIVKLGFRPRGRHASYVDHGARGAAELAAVGAERLVCDFALHHHGSRPSSIEQDEWDVLQRADR